SELLLCHGMVCVVGRMRDLILQLSKSSIYSTKPQQTPVEQSPIDPHGATNLSHQLADEQLNPITIIQNYTNMSDPMKELEAAVESGRFHHDGNPIMTWCISNVVGKHLPGNDDVVRPIKEQNENKIDGAVALIMAIGRAMLFEKEETLSNHLESYGVRSL
ncbi:MAG: terminase TerL endonuclease subunit, partial [Klebsiella michiganensis]|nr:terminase TerL endonuclease subunit [Klebsiella michiganensis]